MKQLVLPVSEFKSKCLRVLDDVAREGNSVIITKHGRSIARVTPFQTAPMTLRGSWKGVVRTKGDIVEFGAEESWEVDQ